MLAALVFLTSCALPTLGDNSPIIATTDQPVRVSGSLSYTNDIFLTYHETHAVALIDMHGFVTRDPSWHVPLPSIAFGRLQIDRDEQEASYVLDLPLHPSARSSDVDRDGRGGVKVYAISYWSDPYEDNEVFYGWPNYLASIRTDAEQSDEVVGGKMVVWSPDESQQFPSAFGDDGQLFTDDDPLQPLAAGYSIVDLDTQPFALDRSRRPELALYEPYNVSTKNLSALRYPEAFKQLFDQARLEYAFNGTPGKEPDWDGLLDEIEPRVIEADRKNDPQAFYLAVRDFINGFHDGHTMIDGGDLAYEIEDEAYNGGYGLAIRELDDGRALVVYVLDDGPAARAGIREGAEVLAVDGVLIDDAIAQAAPHNGPFSTDRALRYDQSRFLLRRPLGTKLSVTFANPAAAQQTAELTAVDEFDSLQVTSIHRGSDPTAAPVEYWVLNSGLGYVRINSNDDDNELIDELFRRALDSFEYHEVPGIIVDLRQNSGGTNLELAGYLTDKAIPLAQLEYFSESSKRFEPDGQADEVTPVEEPYIFGGIAVLVGPACFSACELEAYGFSKLPGAIVVGHEPTAGVEAEVSEGYFKLPEDIWITIPTGRFVLPDGSLFLEGSGVAPTVRVPVDESTALSDEDEVLKAAEAALGIQH